MPRMLTPEEVQLALDRVAVPPPDMAIEPFHDEACGPALRVFLALSDGQIGKDLAPDDLLYNRYYWLNRYTSAYEAKFGYDAGNEQQISMLLERIDFEVDWNVLEDLHNAARGKP